MVTLVPACPVEGCISLTTPWTMYVQMSPLDWTIADVSAVIAIDTGVFTVIFPFACTRTSIDVAVD